MKDNILPLGTVVILEDGDGSELMIVARGSVIEEKKKMFYYDYGAVLVPQGMLAPEAVYFFNKENVAKIIFKGYENDSEREFQIGYDEMIEKSGYKKGTILN
ncbi:DUF4176 domain-containing protein [Enterococcus rivorum]|nr:DUF4176 domain-containing protein [Enterococcus rivorum]MBP2099834.1 hypothetical protein [Enterococcus rivorum]